MFGEVDVRLGKAAKEMLGIRKRCIFWRRRVGIEMPFFRIKTMGTQNVVP